MGAAASSKDAAAMDAAGEGTDGVAAAGAAELLKGVDSAMLSPEQRHSMEQLRVLLEDAGWTDGSDRSGVSVAFKFAFQSGLNYTCSTCKVPDTAEGMFDDFNKGGAQQRYNDVCGEEGTLEEKKNAKPLGNERRIRAIYKFPFPFKDREFIWREWAALLPTEDGGKLYISIAITPPEEGQTPSSAALLEKYVRGHLHLAATMARQAPGSEEVTDCASIIMGDVKGNMPKMLQNMVAGNASSYLSNFRDAHDKLIPKTA
ncbi:unnamed protein product [Polarella glacialis]|uniref:Uncharacterized protein n=1 Tax=Polarella glacialis TaxID=89957 RepID=A0A813EXX3_POLGL|nr:unnamed protein product [Polarella glacialis]